MTQLNCVTPLNNNTVAGASIVAPGNQDPSSSFQSQLSEALTATLQKFGIDPSKFALSIAPVVTNGTRSQSPTSVTPPPPSSLGDGTLASQDPGLNFDDAYWAKQPPAVQA